MTENRNGVAFRYSTRPRPCLTSPGLAMPRRALPDSAPTGHAASLSAKSSGTARTSLPACTGCTIHAAPNHAQCHRNQPHLATPRPAATCRTGTRHALRHLAVAIVCHQTTTLGVYPVPPETCKAFACWIDAERCRQTKTLCVGPGGTLLKKSIAQVGM